MTFSSLLGEAREGKRHVKDALKAKDNGNRSSPSRGIQLAGSAWG